MDGVINNPLSGQKYIQYGKFTFENITDQLEVRDSSEVDMSKMVKWDRTHAQNVAAWKKYYSDVALGRSPVAGVKQEVDGETDAAINGFFDGTVSGEELAETFQALVGKLSAACEDAGYPIPLQGIQTTQAFTETFYSEFRRKILYAAVQRNFQEGQQYITGEMNAQRNWKYYNSDYYFKSEEAISVITDGLDKLAQGPAYKGFALPDYKAQGLNLYYNFNSAFSNQFCADEQFMKDSDMVPPKDFRWFYQSGGDSSRKVFQARLVSINGVPVKYDNDPKHFDPTDFTTATTWAAYRNAQGNRHVVSTDFFYDLSKNDLRNVGALLQFASGDAAQDAAVNRFLKNLQAYPAGYFSRFPQQQRGVSLRA